MNHDPSPSPAAPAPPPALAPEPSLDAAPYRDDDLVYVDPDERKVVGRVQWSNSGKPKSLTVEKVEESHDADGKGRRRRGRERKYYPWGTYRSMKRIYKIEGKIREEKTERSLDEVIHLALKEPFWD